jgi:dTDP-4-dehydrorhamnose reductase
MLATDVVGTFERAGHEVSAIGIEDADITDREATLAAVEEARPEVVLNCAAYTDVDGAERDPDMALAVNGDGARHLAEGAARAGAPLVYPSTDYVFDGEKRTPYVESDAPGPVSSYGSSKLAGEEATREASPRHLIVRTSWLFGVAGPNFVETILRLAGERNELRVVDDQVGCPTYSQDLAGALLELVESGARGVHHVAGGGQGSWFDFARAIVESAGAECRVEPCTSEEFPRPARRPAYSVLRSERERPVELPDWRDALERYMAEREVRA